MTDIGHAAPHLPGSVPAPALWRVGHELVEAALAGAGDTELVAVFGAALNGAGVDIAMIEVACDAVDPERANHFLHWRRGRGTESGEILCGGIFDAMLETASQTLRLSAEDDRFATLLRQGASDAVAFVQHLAPEVTLGFFDDVMSLFATDQEGGFTDRQIDILTRVTPLFALALGARLNAAAARGLLRIYLGGDAATALFDGRVGLGDVAQTRAVVIYCDMLDFTSTTEALEAHRLIDRLNRFFETITRPVTAAGGQVAGHVGDAVVMFFPVRNAADERLLLGTAVRTALAGLEALRIANEAQAADPVGPLRARIGIDVGDVVHGNIGSAGRFSFTIIGTPVNRAARLQNLAKSLGASLLMTADAASAAALRCHDFGTHALKGYPAPTTIVGFRNEDDVTFLQQN